MQPPLSIPHCGSQSRTPELAFQTRKFGRVFERFTQADSVSTTSQVRRLGARGYRFRSPRLVEALGAHLGRPSARAACLPSRCHSTGPRPIGPRPRRSAQDLSRHCQRYVFLWRRSTPTTARSRWPTWRTRPVPGRSRRDRALACEKFMAGRYDLHVLMDRQMPCHRWFDRDANDSSVGKGQRPRAHTDNHTNGLCLEGR